MTELSKSWVTAAGQKKHKNHCLYKELVIFCFESALTEAFDEADVRQG